MHQSPLIVSGTLFALFALVHLWRLVTEKHIVLGDTVVPLWVSVIALIVSALLSLWMFLSAGCFSSCCGAKKSDYKDRNKNNDNDNNI